MRSFLRGLIVGAVAAAVISHAYYTRPARMDNEQTQSVKEKTGKRLCTSA